MKNVTRKLLETASSGFTSQDWLTRPGLLCQMASGTLPSPSGPRWDDQPSSISGPEASRHTSLAHTALVHTSIIQRTSFPRLSFTPPGAEGCPRPCHSLSLHPEKASVPTVFAVVKGQNYSNLNMLIGFVFNSGAM
jgi:hypothetical protein